MMRALLTFAVGAYIGAGLLMQRAIPALNPLGITYIGATWPVQIACTRKDSGCDPTPPMWLQPYMFSFPARG